VSARFTDQAYLKGEQYRDDSNLRARMELHRRFDTNPEPWHRWVFDRLDLTAEADILEVGCGPAELWVQNRDRIPDGWRLTLADLSPGMVEEARRVLGDRAAYGVADIQDLPFEDASFDGVIANHMLYHVSDRPRAFHEVSRVLRPGGIFFCSTNGSDHLKEIKALYDQTEEPWSWQFRLEDAGAELREVFDDVQVATHPGGLAVTEVEPVVAFVNSLAKGIDGFEETVRRRIETEGVFRVTKVGGLFRCRKR